MARTTSKSEDIERGSANFGHNATSGRPSRYNISSSRRQFVSASTPRRKRSSSLKEKIQTTKRRGLKGNFLMQREKIWARKRRRTEGRVQLHRSFRRSYYEDYERPLEIPGLLSHALTTFQIFLRNWRLFVPMILWLVVFNIILVGLMSEDTYTTLQDTLESNAETAGETLTKFSKAGTLFVSTVLTGGLSSGLSEVQQVYAILIFIVAWLTTIYLTRHRLAGHKVRLRDGFYNAMTPLISSLLIVLMIMMELIPIIIVVVVYSAAVTTNFLSTPFYAFLFFIFAALMITLSAFLIAESFMALFAVSVPGIYPMEALRISTDLMAGRKIKFLIRLIYLVLALIVIWTIIMLPTILADLWVKEHVEWMTGIPVVPFVLMVMTVFSIIYMTIYCYLFYRRILDYDDEWARTGKAPGGEEWEPIESKGRSV